MHRRQAMLAQLTSPDKADLYEKKAEGECFLWGILFIGIEYAV